MGIVYGLSFPRFVAACHVDDRVTRRLQNACGDGRSATGLALGDDRPLTREYGQIVR